MESSSSHEQTPAAGVGGGRVAGLAAAMLLVLSGCAGEGAPDGGPSPRPVRVTEVRPDPGVRSRSFAGRTRAPMESRLSFRVGGRIREVAVERGTRVDRGDLVAVLDDRDQRTRVREAEAALARARAEAENARRDFERTRALFEEGAVSRSDLDQARTRRNTTRALAREARERVEMARRQRAYTRLRAPSAGAIARVVAEAGENVAPGQPVAELTAGDGLEVETTVPEGFVRRVREGQEARVSLSAFPGRDLRATVTEVAVSPVREGEAYPVTLRLQEPPDGARPGLAARIRFRIPDGSGGEDVVRVPSVAVGEDPRGPFVFVFRPDSVGTPDDPARRTSGPDPGTGTAGTVERRPVRVGDLGPEGLAVRGDLEPGEWVVTAGVGRLRDGQRVRRTGRSAEPPSPRSPISRRERR